MQSGKGQTEAWYRVPIVWLVLAVLASAVVMGGSMLYFSIVSFDGMVVDDYYKEGKKINRVLRRDKAAMGHGLKALLTVEGSKLKIQLDSNTDYSPPPVLEVNFFYSTRAGLDKATFVDMQQPGIYISDFVQLEHGRWNLQIEADDWRLVGSLQVPEQTSAPVEPAISR